MVSRDCVCVHCQLLFQALSRLCTDSAQSLSIWGTYTLSIVCCGLLPSPPFLGDVQGVHFISCIIMRNLLVRNAVTF